MSVHCGGRGPGHTSRWALAVAASGGLGPETVTNGGFDTATDWSGAEFSISGGEGRFATSLGRTAINTTGAVAEIGATYRATYTVTSYTSGTSVRIRIGGALGTGRNAVGTYTEDIVATSATAPAFITAGAVTCALDSVSAKKVL